MIDFDMLKGLNWVIFLLKSKEQIGHKAINIYKLPY